MIDVLATITREEYRIIKATLETEGLWNIGGNYAKECQANKRAEQILAELRK
jgi:hypothetical protein